MDLNDLTPGLGGLWRLSQAKTRSINPENPTGAKGQGAMATQGRGARAARDLGAGWKVSPSIEIAPGSTVPLAEIEGPAVIQHVWMTCHSPSWRSLVLRCYWDGESDPSVQVPYGDFFCNGWKEQALVQSVPVAANPAGGMNAFWPMPFRRSARVTLENLGDDPVILYYQTTYALTDLPAEVGYFHAQSQWRRSNPVPYGKVHTVLDGVTGRGQYVGTYLAWGVNNNGWWGEGEMKFYIDGDTEYPTICYTGTEDYFGGAWNFEHPKGQYGIYSTPFQGLCQVIAPDGLYRSQQRFGMYRWHVMDPIRFDQDLRVTIQALGWRSGGGTCPCKTTWLPQHSGTSRNLMPPSRPCRARTRLR